MNRNIKRIITACLFIIVLTGTLLIMSKITIPKSNAPERGMEEVAANGILAENPDTVDVIFLGDSETYCTFIPLQIWKDEGFTTYIDGTSAQTLDYSLTMLQRALSRHDLKMVFLDANAIATHCRHSNKRAHLNHIGQELVVGTMQHLDTLNG